MLVYLFSGALALSCFTVNEEPVTGCDVYRSDARAYASCLLQERGYSGDVETTCADLGELEGHCRIEWVRRYMPTDEKFIGERSTAELNRACAGISDCLLLVTSLRPSTGVVEQARSCMDLPEKVQDDCLHHVLLPWINGTPTTEEVSALQKIGLPARPFGSYLAMAVECLKMMECPTEGELGRACAIKVSNYRSTPEACALMGKVNTPKPQPVW